MHHKFWNELLNLIYELNRLSLEPEPRLKTSEPKPMLKNYQAGA
jgi:hypothetical protein